MQGGVMSEYLEWKINTNAEAGGAQDAIAYKWCHLIAEDNSHRNILNRRIEELHKLTYISPSEEN
jgi:hypothetical protein